MRVVKEELPGQLGIRQLDDLQFVD